MNIYTARYSYFGSDRLDITRSGSDRLLNEGNNAPGEVLAPSWAILKPFKALSPDGLRAAFPEYARQYFAELEARYQWRSTEFLRLLERDYTYVCFCQNKDLCHRTLEPWRYSTRRASNRPTAVETFLTYKPTY